MRKQIEYPLTIGSGREFFVVDWFGVYAYPDDPKEWPIFLEGFPTLALARKAYPDAKTLVRAHGYPSGAAAEARWDTVEHARARIEARRRAGESSAEK